MISSILWVPRGKAKEYPVAANYSEQELQEIQQKLGIQVEQSKAELALAQGMEQTALESDTEIAIETEQVITESMDDDFNKRYDMDNYNEDEAEPTMFSNIKELVHDGEDEYLISDEHEEEKEELRIDPTDNLLLACKTEDEVSCLEVFVYEQEEDNLYIHHDILLPSFPLCLEWLDFRASSEEKGMLLR
jgi:periodic tryptophan protein 1